MIKSVVQVQEKKKLVLKANCDVAVRTLVKAGSRVCRLFGAEQSARNSPTSLRTMSLRLSENGLGVFGFCVQLMRKHALVLVNRWDPRFVWTGLVS